MGNFAACFLAFCKLQQANRCGATRVTAGIACANILYQQRGASAEAERKAQRERRALK